MKKLLSLFALALALIGGNAQAQSYPLPEVIRYGSAITSSGTVAANTAVTMVAAASNTKGMIVWAAMANGQPAVSTDSHRSGFVAHTAAPTTFGGGPGVILAMSHRNFTGGSTHNIAEITRPIFLRAGLGLYYISGVGDLSNHFRYAIFTILN